MNPPLSTICIVAFALLLCTSAGAFGGAQMYRSLRRQRPVTVRVVREEPRPAAAVAVAPGHACQAVDRRAAGRIDVIFDPEPFHAALRQLFAAAESRRLGIELDECVLCALDSPGRLIAVQVTTPRARTIELRLEPNALCGELIARCAETR